jgi:hypothetical protein
MVLSSVSPEFYPFYEVERFQYTTLHKPIRFPSINPTQKPSNLELLSASKEGKRVLIVITRHYIQCSCFISRTNVLTNVLTQLFPACRQVNDFRILDEELFNKCSK